MDSSETKWDGQQMWHCISNNFGLKCSLGHLILFETTLTENIAICDRDNRGNKFDRFFGDSFPDQKPWLTADLAGLKRGIFDLGDLFSRSPVNPKSRFT